MSTQRKSARVMDSSSANILDFNLRGTYIKKSCLGALKEMIKQDAPPPLLSFTPNYEVVRAWLCNKSLSWYQGKTSKTFTNCCHSLKTHADHDNKQIYCEHRRCVIVCVMLVLPVLILSHSCTVLFNSYNATITCITLHLLSFLVKQHKLFVLYSHVILVKKKKKKFQKCSFALSVCRTRIFLYQVEVVLTCTAPARQTNENKYIRTTKTQF